MKEILKIADNYVKSCTWKELALIKFCMCSVGVLVGLAVCKKHKKPTAIVAVGVFVVTLIPLMLGLFKSMEKK